MRFEVIEVGLQGIFVYVRQFFLNVKKLPEPRFLRFIININRAVNPVKLLVVRIEPY